MGYSDHFFEIVVHNVVRHRGDRLLSAIDVSRYLGQVVSVAFHPDFTFGDEITTYLVANGIGDTPLSTEIEGEDPVYRLHRNEIVGGGKTLTLHAPEMFTTPDREGECSAVTWILHHEYLGTLPISTMINGWRLR